MMIRKAAVAAMCAFAFNNVAAYDRLRAFENLIEDSADCTTYYTFVQAAAEANHWDDLAIKLKETRDLSLHMTISLMKGKPEGFLISKLELKHQVMMKKFDADGFDGLQVVYLDMCKGLMENMNARMEYWLAK